MQQAVKTGKVDAGVNDNGLLNYFVSQNPDVEVVTEFKTGEELRLLGQEGRQRRPAHDRQRRDRERTSTTTVYEKWFGTAPTS